MNAESPSQPEWRPSFWRLLLWDTLPFVFGTALAQVLVAHFRHRPVDARDLLLYPCLVGLIGVAFALYNVSSGQYVLRATDTLLLFPARPNARHGSVPIRGLTVPALSLMARAVRFGLTIRLTNIDGSYLAMQPSRYPPVERVRLLTYLEAHQAAA
jgi:hypothetical protein